MENASIVNGRIIKSIGGIYTVEAPIGVLECKARGIFRKRGISPCCGDLVTVELSDIGMGVIVEINERENSLIRPPLANLDLLVFVVASCEPSPNFLIIDKFVAISRYKNIDTAIIITKVDKVNGNKIREIYELAGIPVFEVNNNNSGELREFKSFISNKITAFTGNTGVGKSSLLNNLVPEISVETNEISTKLGRGKHTTRHVELFKFQDGYIADTPGFSTLETNKYDIIRKNQLEDCFDEFEEYKNKCKFHDCAHVKEKGCAVLEAVADGLIHKSRHESYVVMYEEAKQLKDWSDNGR